jgi:hypothetical protein
MELNVSGEICSFAQEEPPGLSDWQLQQMTETNKMVKMYLTIDFLAISISKNEKRINL